MAHAVLKKCIHLRFIPIHCFVFKILSFFCVCSAFTNSQILSLHRRPEWFYSNNHLLIVDSCLFKHCGKSVGNIRNSVYAPVPIGSKMTKLTFYTPQSLSVPSLSCQLKRVEKSKRVKEDKQSAANTGLIHLNLEWQYSLTATWKQKVV